MGAVKKCFYWWRTCSSLSKADQIKFARAMSLWSGKAQSEYFLRWRGVCAESKAFGAGCLLLASKNRRAKLFRAWSVEATRAAALNRCSGSVEDQARHRMQLMCYVKWRAAFHERERRHDILTRAAARIRQRSLSGAFSGWREKAANLIDQREKVEKCLNRIAMRAAAGALSTWSEFAVKQVDLRAKAHAVMARIANGRLIAALNTWIEGGGPTTH